MNHYAYDPFERDAERERDAQRAAQSEHERWSLEQSKLGLSAVQRDGHGVWVKPVLDERS